MPPSPLTKPQPIKSKPKSAGRLGRLVIWLVILTGWEMAFRYIGWRDYVFPAPSHVLDATLSMLNINTEFSAPLHRGWPRLSDGSAYIVGSFWQSSLIVGNVVSISRAAVGFVISVLLGSVLGALMWRSDLVDEFLGPLLLGVQTLPSVCWVPIAILAFGLSEQALMFVLVMGSCFSVAISMRDGLRTIPPLYQRAGRMLGASGWKLYRYVLIPASLPALASGLRQGFSFAWRSLMGGEVFLYTRHAGLGLLLQAGRDNSSPAQVVAVMAMMVSIGIAADRLAFARLERSIYARFGLARS
jgi:NitT/TauT family transport system permease protein